MQLSVVSVSYDQSVAAQLSLPPTPNNNQNHRYSISRSLVLTVDEKESLTKTFTAESFFSMIMQVALYNSMLWINILYYPNNKSSNPSVCADAFSQKLHHQF